MAHRVPHAFRRRLLLLVLAAGLLPVLLLGALGALGLSRALSFSPERLERVLQRADAELGGTGGPTLTRDLKDAQVSLLQAELARKSLVKLAPAALITALVLIALALAAAAVLFGRALARPVEALATDMARISAGQLDLPARELPRADRDELEFLQRELRRTAEKLREQQRRLALSEGLAAWRDVAQKLAHELKNPLTAMKMALGRLARVERSGPDAERLTESVALLTEEVELLLRMTQSFATFARLPEPRLQPLDLAALVKDVCALYEATGPVGVRADVTPPLIVQGDADQLRRAVGNLIKNALEASKPGGPVVEVKAVRDGSRVRIDVSDGGSGIGRVVEGAELTRSLGSTKATGSGLGLPIAHKIVHDHGGALRLEPREQGTRAVVELPGGGP